MQSETECYNGDNLWQQGLITFRKIVEDTSNFAGSYFFWNTVLDDRETSSWGWRQNSLLTVDRSTKQVRYNPEFYAMKHFSASVLPGARRIAVSGGPFPQIVAFANPNGSSGPRIRERVRAIAGRNPPVRRQALPPPRPRQVHEHRHPRRAAHLATLNRGRVPHSCASFAHEWAFAKCRWSRGCTTRNGETKQLFGPQGDAKDGA